MKDQDPGLSHVFFFYHFHVREKKKEAISTKNFNRDYL